MKIWNIDFIKIIMKEDLDVAIVLKRGNSNELSLLMGFGMLRVGNITRGICVFKTIVWEY